MRPAGKLEELFHGTDKNHWHILGLFEMHWKNFGEMSTDDRHKVYFSGEEDRREYGVRFQVHMDMVSAVMGCRQSLAD